MKHFWTKFLASGLLTLNLSGCLQATDDVKSNPASVWKHQSTFQGLPKSITEFDNTLFVGNFESNANISGLTIYKSSDGETWSSIFKASDIHMNYFNFYQANGNLFFFGAPYAVNNNSNNFTYYLYQYKKQNEEQTFTKICKLGGNYEKPVLNSPSSLFYAFNNYYYTFIDLTNAQNDGTGTVYSVYKIDLTNKTTSKVCDSDGIVFPMKDNQGNNQFFSLSTSELKMINFDGTSISKSQTVLSKDKMTNGIYTIKISSTRVVVCGTGSQIAVCNKSNLFSGNPDWQIHSIKINKKDVSTGIYPNVVNKDETFVFIFPASSSQAELNGVILSTSDFENWTYQRNSSYKETLGDINWNGYIYSSLLDKFVICGFVSSKPVKEKYGGNGVIFTADYTSLSSLSEISQAAYVTDFQTLLM